MTMTPLTARQKEFCFDFGRRLANRRQALGLSRPKLAGIVDVHPKSIKGWERGSSTVNAYALAKLAGALETTADALLGLTTEE